MLNSDAMSQIRIHLLTSINSLVLLVYDCDARAWQLGIISGSAVFGECKIYYCAVAA
jgi:hypothetical protein